MNEVKRARTKVAIKLANFALAIAGGLLEGTQLECEREASEILSLEGIAVLDDDQSLPEIKTGEWCNRGCHEIEQDNMRKAGFKKVKG